MSTTTIHCCASVTGMLRNLKFPRDYVGIFTSDDGTPLTADQAREFLRSELALGHKVIPCSPCDNFDYSGGGCQGHPVQSTEA